MYNFNTLKEKLKSVETHLATELSVIRTGRANPNLLDGVKVECYGALMAIKEVASMATDDARTIRIVPYDMTVIKEIEKGVIGANLGVSVAVDDKGVRVFFPELTVERRTILIKLAKEKLENARKSVRSLRDDTWNDIQAKEKEGGMGEDEKFRHKIDMQKLVDETNQKLEEHIEKKEKEINS